LGLPNHPNPKFGSNEVKSSVQFSMRGVRCQNNETKIKKIKATRFD
jgi:hypothetical protein